ncbi:ATP synthase epsilon chain [Mesoplasma florum W37]|uniref:ATP synthase epsilon chain n=1 Tax=Mesoplasma florum TaxID=2151 RepID=A0AAD2JDB5_MESFO|nr:ATP synthase epsilon chain [Mesoplasma florum]AGY41189.1 ATP synthase epsilon chain [Mesoplasma florum W37]AVN59420.1 hypothetical protein CG008_00620 [Mesoplasma florum]AVN65527.1 ATP synthase epsilon chain [Mesoplasma florum]
MAINLIITTPNGKFIDNKKVDIINLKTIDGDIGVLGNMSPLVTALKIGNMNFKVNNQTNWIHLHRGLAIINATECKIITERLYLVNENGTKIPTPDKLD